MTVVAVLGAHTSSRRQLCRSLMADFEVLEYGVELESLRATLADRPHLVVLDADTSAMDGNELIRLLRVVMDFPMIAVLDSPSPARVVKALEAGADDAVAKDCESPELIARVRALARLVDRQPEDPSSQKIATGTLEIDRGAQFVRKRGELLHLTPTEFRLLDALAARIDRVVSRRQLLAAGWGFEYLNDTHYLHVYIGYLRAKIEDDPSNPRYVINERGTGYRLALLPETKNGHHADALREERPARELVS